MAVEKSTLHEAPELTPDEHKDLQEPASAGQAPAKETLAEEQAPAQEASAEEKPSSEDAAHAGAPSSDDSVTPTQELVRPAVPADLAERVEVLHPTVQEEDPEVAEALRQLELRRAKRRRNNVIKGVIAAAVALVLFFVFVGPMIFPKPQEEVVMPPELVMVAPTTFETTVSASGTLAPNNAVSVTPEVEGIIESLNVKQDQIVNEGDLLFTIKADALDRSIKEAEQGVTAAQRDLNSANGSVEKAQNAYNKAYNEYQRAYAAWQADPEANLQPDPFDEDSYASAIETAQSSVESAEVSLNNARDTLAEAQNQGNKRQVKAPTSGAVVSLKIEEGAAASASSAALQIADLSKMRVSVQVNEADISSVKAGQTATVTFSAIQGLTLEATVERIASVATGMENLSEGGGNGGVANFTVDLVIPNPDPRLKPGMTANVSIRTEYLENALTLPVAAVIPNEDGTGSVMVVTNPEVSAKEKFTEADLQLEEREVKLGPKSASDYVITGGLKDGECVLVGSGSASSGDAAAAEGTEMSAESAALMG